jgi:hypothetical protein
MTDEEPKTDAREAVASEALEPTRAEPPDAAATAEVPARSGSARGRDRRRTGRPAKARPARGGEPGSGRRGVSLGGRGVWIAVAVVALLGCGLLSVGALSGTGLFGGRQARTQAAMDAADGHWQKATVAMERAAAAFSGLKTAVGPATTTAVASAAAEASSAVSQAQVELKGAGDAVADLPDSALKTSYQGAIKEADAALASLDSMLASLMAANRIYGAAAVGAQRVRVGTTHLAAAIVATNNDRYPDAHREALAAARVFDSARVSFKAGEAIDPKAGFDKAIVYTDKLSAEAKLLLQLADAGASKQIAKYDALAATQAATQKQLAALAQPPMIANGVRRVVGPMDRQRAAIRAHLDKAQKLYDQARAEFKATQK